MEDGTRQYATGTPDELQEAENRLGPIAQQIRAPTRPPIQAMGRYLFLFGLLLCWSGRAAAAKQLLAARLFVSYTRHLDALNSTGETSDLWESARCARCADTSRWFFKVRTVR